MFGSFATVSTHVLANTIMVDGASGPSLGGVSSIGSGTYTEFAPGADGGGELTTICGEDVLVKRLHPTSPETSPPTSASFQRPSMVLPSNEAGRPKPPVRCVNLGRSCRSVELGDEA